MKKNLKSKNVGAGFKPAPTNRGVAFFWDESFLWGLMAYRALQNLGLPFDLVRSDDIKNGCLEYYKMLFVPGGWASNKLKSLGDAGIREINKFVKNGGNYLGFCGGAGLATLDGIGLLNITRKPTKERVPSFSGRIHLNLKKHPIWEGLIKGQGARGKGQGNVNSTLKIQHSKNLSLVTGHWSLVFHAWWPSQFVIKDNSVNVLATFGKALPDSFSSDLNAGDIEATKNWEELEKLYQINLNPRRLLNGPAVLEGSYGKGKVVLSLTHFDTPDDINGQQVLKNLWEYIGGKQRSAEVRKRGSAEVTSELPSFRASELFALCSDLISFGERNFLWFRRNPMLLQWRRGVRGLEYCTLYEMVKEIEEIVRKNRSAEVRKCGSAKVKTSGLSFDDNVYNIGKLLVPFIEKAKRLLMLERHALQKGHITYEKCGDPEIQKIRAELFSESKSHGGMFKELIDEIDNILYKSLSLS